MEEETILKEDGLLCKDASLHTEDSAAYPDDSLLNSEDEFPSIQIQWPTDKPKECQDKQPPKSPNTVLCKSNANVFRRNSRLFLAFRQKNIKFSMEANLQRKVMIIRDAYCFQLCEFSNDNSLGTKIYFKFSSENSKCSINDLEHLNEISLFICSAQTFPRIFWTIICPVRICRGDSFLMSLQCKLYDKLVSVYTTDRYKTHLYYFKGSFYCLLHVESIAAPTPLFCGGFLAHVCRTQGPLADMAMFA